MKNRTKIITSTMIAGPSTFLITEFIRRQTDIAQIGDSFIVSVLLFITTLLFATATILAFVLGEKHE